MRHRDPPPIPPRPHPPPPPLHRHYNRKCWSHFALKSMGGKGLSVSPLEVKMPSQKLKLLLTFGGIFKQTKLVLGYCLYIRLFVARPQSLFAIKTATRCTNQPKFETSMIHYSQKASHQPRQFVTCIIGLCICTETMALTAWLPKHLHDLAGIF